MEIASARAERVPPADDPGLPAAGSAPADRAHRPPAGPSAALTVGAAATGASPAEPLGLTVYGARTCEDTAITRSRLRALGVPFRDIDIDTDADGMAWVLALEGRRATPTVVFGAGETVVAEPSIERLDSLLEAAGYRFERPVATQFHGSFTSRSVPLRALSSSLGERFSLELTRGRLQAAVFFAHDAVCLACHGYARQLAAQAAAMEDADAVPLITVQGEAGAALGWAAEMPAGARILADPGGAWKRSVAAAIGADAAQLMLLVLDRWAAPRAVSCADEAGGLAAPSEATDWLRYLALECPECAGELPWPD